MKIFIVETTFRFTFMKAHGWCWQLHLEFWHNAINRTESFSKLSTRDICKLRFWWQEPLERVSSDAVGDLPSQKLLLSSTISSLAPPPLLSEMSWWSTRITESRRPLPPLFASFWLSAFKKDAPASGLPKPLPWFWKLLDEIWFWNCSFGSSCYDALCLSWSMAFLSSCWFWISVSSAALSSALLSSMKLACWSREAGMMISLFKPNLTSPFCLSCLMPSLT